jgi:hypothetical protein
MKQLVALVAISIIALGITTTVEGSVYKVKVYIINATKLHQPMFIHICAESDFCHANESYIDIRKAIDKANNSTFYFKTLKVVDTNTTRPADTFICGKLEDKTGVAVDCPHANLTRIDDGLYRADVNFSALYKEWTSYH